MEVYNVHGGHNRKAPGIISYLDEVTEDRKIKDAVIKYLRNAGNTAYDCTDDAASTASGVLKNIVKKCNQHTVSLDISIHLNGSKKSSADGKNKGCEVYVYSKSSKAKAAAEWVCKKLNALGFTNRGVKYKTSLYVLKHTKSPAMLIEVCFADDEDDVILYKKLGADAIGKAIAEGITGGAISGATTTPQTIKPASSSFRVKTKTTMAIRIGAGTNYKKVGNAPVGVYTIVETKYNGSTPWGRLKSGAGWISIHSKYCSRV